MSHQHSLCSKASMPPVPASLLELLRVVGDGQPVWQHLPSKVDHPHRPSARAAFRATCRALRTLADQLITDVQHLQLGQCSSSHSSHGCGENAPPCWVLGQWQGPWPFSVKQHEAARAFLYRLKCVQSVMVVLRRGGDAQLLRLLQEGCFPTSLQQLNLEARECPVPLAIASALAPSMPSLRHLHLGVQLLPPGWLAALAACSSLRALHLHNTRLDPSSATELSSLSHLSHLTLAGVKLLGTDSDFSLASLQPLTSLHHLHLSIEGLALLGPAASQELQLLSSFRNLEVLHLESGIGSGAGPGNLAVPEFLSTLTCLTRLRDLAVGFLSLEQLMGEGGRQLQGLTRLAVGELDLREPEQRLSLPNLQVLESLDPTEGAELATVACLLQSAPQLHQLVMDSVRVPVVEWQQHPLQDQQLQQYEQQHHHDHQQQQQHHHHHQHLLDHHQAHPHHQLTAVVEQLRILAQAIPRLGGIHDCRGVQCGLPLDFCGAPTIPPPFLSALQPMSSCSHPALKLLNTQAISPAAIHALVNAVPNLESLTVAGLDFCGLCLLTFLRHLRALDVESHIKLSAETMPVIESMQLTRLSMALPCQGMQVGPWPAGRSRASLPHLKDLELNCLGFCIPLADVHYLLHAAPALQHARLPITVLMPPVPVDRGTAGVWCVGELLQQVLERLVDVGGRGHTCMAASLQLCFGRHKYYTRVPLMEALKPLRRCLQANVGLSMLHGFGAEEAQALVSAVPELRELSVSECVVGGKALEVLAGLKQLRRLCVSKCSGSVRGEDVMQLQRALPGTEVVVMGCGWWGAADQVELGREMQAHWRAACECTG